MIIADTNVVSELMKPAPELAVVEWARLIGPEDLGICVVTVEEVERGIGRLPDGRRRRELQQAWRALLDRFDDQIASYDVVAARRTAAILVAAEEAGRPMSLADAQIAGICLVSGSELATRNVADFQAVEGLVVLDPCQGSRVGPGRDGPSPSI